jgi:hypothetical protein
MKPKFEIGDFVSPIVSSSKHAQLIEILKPLGDEKYRGIVVETTGNAFAPNEVVILSLVEYELNIKYMRFKKWNDELKEMVND